MILGNKCNLRLQQCRVKALGDRQGSSWVNTLLARLLYESFKNHPWFVILGGKDGGTLHPLTRDWLLVAVCQGSQGTKVTLQWKIRGPVTIRQR